MQLVFIEGLKVNTVIGVYDWERVIKQLLVIDVKLYHNMANAFASDDVKDAINYKTVCEEIEQICHQEQAKLLERLGNKIIEFLFETYPCHKIELTIKKPNAINKADSVGIMMICER